MECRSSGGSITVRLAPRVGVYSGMPEVRRFNVLVHTPRPSRVLLDGMPLPEGPHGWQYDRAAGALRVVVSEDPRRRAARTLQLHAAAARRTDAAHASGGPGSPAFLVRRERIMSHTHTQRSGSPNANLNACRAVRAAVRQAHLAFSVEEYEPPAFARMSSVRCRFIDERAPAAVVYDPFFLCPPVRRGAIPARGATAREYSDR
jgi:hypothetical protein